MAYNYALHRNGNFTEDVQKLLTDDEFSRFQFFPALNPDYGEVIPETGGLRKVRWVSGGKGKRAGVRVIYFHQVKHYEIRLLLIYRKGIKDDLSPGKKQCSVVKYEVVNG